MKILTHEGLQYFYNQIAAKFSTKEQTAEAIEEAVGNAGVGTVTSVNGKTGVVQLSASDVGALPASTQIPSIAGLATETYVDNKVAAMVDSAPETLNTLNELAAALGDDPNFATTVATEIGGKVSKSGDTMTGQLTAPRFLIKSGDGYPALVYLNANGTPISAIHTGEDTHRTYIAQTAIDTSYQESYMFPAISTGLTASKSYSVLTSKSPVTIAQGGTGATNAATARTNLGALPGQTISYTLSTAGWYRIASSKVGIDNNIGDFTICGGGSGTHTIVSFKAAIAVGKNPQILQLLNTTYSGVNQYTKARIVYHTTYSGNYAYLEVYKNGTASSSTKFMYYGEGWTLQSPVAGSIPSGYTSKEFTFVPQTSIASTENINVVSDVTGKDFDVGVQNPNGHIALQVSTNRGLWDYDKSAWVLRALKGSTAWHLDGTAAALQDVNVSTATLSISMNHTPIIWARNNGKTSWSLERNGATQNTMAAHYYDEDGNWTTSGFLLDHQNFTTYVTPSAIGALPTNPDSIEFMPGTSANHGGFIDFHFNRSSADHTSRIIESSSSVLDINNVSGGKVRLGTVTAGTWNGSAIPIANGGTGAVNEVTAANNLKIQSLGHGTDIPANANLNTYTTVGNYRCGSTSTGATITNCPVANAFTLQVYASTGTSTSAPTTAGWAYFLQKLTTIGGAQYYRTVTFSNSTTASFSDWAKIYDSVNNKPTAADVGALALTGGTVSGAVTINNTLTATKVIGAVYA